MITPPASRVISALTKDPALVYLPIPDCASAIGMSPAALVKAYANCPELADLIDQLPDLQPRQCGYCKIEMELCNTQHGVMWSCPHCYLQTPVRSRRPHDPDCEDTIAGYRRCAMCKQWKPPTPEYFVIDRGRTSELRARCRECDREQKRKRYAANHERELNRMRANRRKAKEAKQRKQSNHDPI